MVPAGVGSPTIKVERSVCQLEGCVEKGSNPNPLHLVKRDLNPENEATRVCQVIP